jgi:hypothetical protein
VIKTELNFGNVHLISNADAGILVAEIAKTVQVNTDEIMAEGAYRAAQPRTKPYRLTVTVELSEA